MPKRTYGTGTMRLRGRNWYVGYRVNGAQKWEAAGPDRAAAEAVLHDRLAAARRGRTPRPSGRLFGDVAADWLRARETDSDLSARTVEIDEIALRCHLQPALGDDRIDDIDADLVKQYKAAKLTGANPRNGEALPVAGRAKEGALLSARSVNQHLTVLGQVFDHALDKGWIERNPMGLVKRAPERPDPVEPLERAQVRALLDAFKDDEYRMLVSTMARLGLRLGEALALQETDYIAGARVLKVRRTLNRDGGKVRVGLYPKTRAGARDLKVTDSFHTALTSYMDGRTSKPNGNGLLFSNHTGGIINPSNFRSRAWARAIRKAELPDSVTPHHLRHTYASEQIAANAPDTALAYRLGHRDSSVTRRIYGHIFARHREEAADLTIYDDEPADVDPTAEGEAASHESKR